MRTVSTDFRLTPEDQAEIAAFVRECRKQFGTGARLVSTSIRTVGDSRKESSSRKAKTPATCSTGV